MTDMTLTDAKANMPCSENARMAFSEFDGYHQRLTQIIEKPTRSKLSHANTHLRKPNMFSQVVKLYRTKDQSSDYVPSMSALAAAYRKAGSKVSADGQLPDAIVKTLRSKKFEPTDAQKRAAKKLTTKKTSKTASAYNVHMRKFMGGTHKWSMEAASFVYRAMRDKNAGFKGVVLPTNIKLRDKLEKTENKLVKQLTSAQLKRLATFYGQMTAEDVGAREIDVDIRVKSYHQRAFFTAYVKHGWSPKAIAEIMTKVIGGDLSVPMPSEFSTRGREVAPSSYTSDMKPIRVGRLQKKRRAEINNKLKHMSSPNKRNDADEYFEEDLAGL